MSIGVQVNSSETRQDCRNENSERNRFIVIEWKLRINIQQITDITVPSSHDYIITRTRSFIKRRYMPRGLATYDSNPRIMLIGNIKRCANIVVLVNLITASITHPSVSLHLCGCVCVCARACGHDRLFRVCTSTSVSGYRVVIRRGTRREEHSKSKRGTSEQ